MMRFPLTAVLFKEGAAVAAAEAGKGDGAWAEQEVKSSRLRLVPQLVLDASALGLQDEVSTALACASMGGHWSVKLPAWLLVRSRHLRQSCGLLLPASVCIARVGRAD
jgi:hypothetical protein